MNAINSNQALKQDFTVLKIKINELNWESG